MGDQTFAGTSPGGNVVRRAKSREKVGTNAEGGAAREKTFEKSSVTTDNTVG